jgi:hypothetical protein
MIDGITNPTAVPIVFIDAKTAVATGRLNLNKVYVLILEPVGSDFSWCINDKWLTNCTEQLTYNYIRK